MADPAQDAAPTVLTIGHSNHPMETFLGLLETFEVQVVVDVRSSPYATYATHFSKGVLEAPLRERGVRYLFLGQALGGRPEGARFYDDEGFVLYGRIAASPAFQQGIERVLRGAREFRVALLCSEEDPTECHRRLLLGRVLRDRGVRVLHIRGDGRAQSQEEVAADEEFGKTKGQLTLFDMQEPAPWRSTRSVSPRRAPGSSSRPSGEPGSDGSSTCG